MDSVGKMPYALKYGLILGLFSVVFATLSNLTGLTESSVGSAISVPVTILFFVLTFFLAFKAFRTDNGGMSFGDGLGLGALISLVSGLISAIYNFVYTTFIDPGMMERIMEAQYEAMEGYGLSDEQIEAQMEMASALTGNPVFGIVMAIVGSLCFGFVISVIMSAIMKKEKAPDWVEEKY